MVASVLSLSDAKKQLRLTDSDDDTLVEAAIAAAVDHVEHYTGLTLAQREVSEPAPGLGGRLTTWPVRAITSVIYRDGAGAEQQLDGGGWWANLAARPVRLNPAGSGWPALGAGAAPVTVVMQAGYEDGAVPAAIVQAVKMLVSYFYEDRAGEGEPPAPVAALLRAHRPQLV